MRLLQRFTPVLRLLRLLRNNAEAGQRALLIVGPSREGNREFLRGMLLGCLELGYSLGVCEPDDDALHLPGLQWVVRGEIDQFQALRAFARQDPDSLLVSELQRSSLEMFSQLLLTGHAAGSMATVLAPHVETLREWVGENAFWLHGSLIVQLQDGVLNRIVLLDNGEWTTLYAIRELDFDAERDPARYAQFCAEQHVFSDRLAELEAELATPPEVQNRNPEEPEVQPAPPLELRRPCWLARAGEHQPALLAECEAASDWPQLLGRPGLLVLQLAPDQLQLLQLGLESGGWLQLFFAAHPEDIEDFQDPHHPGFLVRRTDVPVGNVALLHESFPLQLEPGDDFPDYAESDDIEGHGNQRASKLGGWPSWLQARGTPACRQCGQPMQFVFQFSNRTLPETATGGDFYDYLFVCREHPEQWGMVHQCT
jgi:hypothetical protein